MLYSTIDDLLKMQKRKGEWCRSNNKPRFTDAEVLTIALMQSYFRTDTLKRTYLLVRANDPTAFGHLPGYKQWLARLHQLAGQTSELIFSVALATEDLAAELYLIDAYPVKMCRAIRHGRVNLLRHQGAYFGKSSTGWFFGFKRHVLTSRNGKIIGAVMTNGNVADRDGARLLTQVLEENSLCLADLGYRGETFQTEILEGEGALILTRDDLPSEELKRLHSQIRSRRVSRIISRNIFSCTRSSLTACPESDAIAVSAFKKPCLSENQAGGTYLGFHGQSGAIAQAFMQFWFYQRLV